MQAMPQGVADVDMTIDDFRQASAQQPEPR
jgi:hypothetical protein